jgi:hypothetical protein
MSALQELLNLGLVEIGADDSRFLRMQSAASAFSTKLKDEPDFLIPSALIAIDNEVDENNPLFILVEDMVIVEWPTMRNTHVNRPRELLRSIIIAALETTINENPEAAGVVYNTVASPLKFGQVRLGKAAVVVERLLKEAARIAETEAVKRAGLMTSRMKIHEKKPIHETPSLEIKSTVSDSDILADLVGASGPHNAQSLPGTNPNPHWPNAGHPWSYEFAPRMAATLVKAVNLGTQRLGASLSKSLATYLSNLNDEVRQAEQLCVEISESRNISQMRLNVLWWSEALYSPMIGSSYRELALPVAAVIAARDLTAIVPALSPVSVSYVLAETVLRLSRILEHDEIQSISFYLGELATAKNKFLKSFSQVSTIQRQPLLDLVVDASGGIEPSEGNSRLRTGLDISLKLSSGEFAMWVFHDLQARRLVEELKG